MMKFNTPPEKIMGSGPKSIILDKIEQLEKQKKETQSILDRGKLEIEIMRLSCKLKKSK